MLKKFNTVVRIKAKEEVDDTDVSTESSERELTKTTSIDSVDVKKSTDGEEDDEDDEDTGLSLMDFLKKEPPKKESKNDEVLSLFDMLKTSDEPPKKEKPPRRDLSDVKKKSKDEELFSLFDILNEEKEMKKEEKNSKPKKKKDEEMFSLFDLLKEENESTKKNTKKLKKVDDTKGSGGGLNVFAKSFSKKKPVEEEQEVSIFDFLKGDKEDENLPKKEKKNEKKETGLSLLDLLREEQEEKERKAKKQSFSFMKKKEEKPKKNEELSLSDLLKEEKKSKSFAKPKEEKTLKRGDESAQSQYFNMFKSFSKKKPMTETTTPIDDIPDEEEVEGEELSIFDFLKAPPKETEIKKKSEKNSLTEEIKENAEQIPETPRTKKRKDSIISSSFFLRKKETASTSTSTAATTLALEKKAKSWSSIEENESKIKVEKNSQAKEPVVDEDTVPKQPTTPRGRRPSAFKLPKFMLGERGDVTEAVPETPALKDDEPTATQQPVTPRSRRNSIKLPKFVLNEKQTTDGNLLSPTSSSNNNAPTIERKKHETLISVFGGKKKEKESPNISTITSTTNEGQTNSEDGADTDSNSTHKDEEEQIKKRILESRIITELFPFQFCVTDEICSKYFKKCLESQYCSENLIFYNSIKEFKQMENSDERRIFAASIMKEFFDVDSQYELNIQTADIYECKSKFDEFRDSEFPTTFFDDLLRKILTMLKIEEYHKFITSQHFEEYYRNHGHNIFIAMQESKWKSTEDTNKVDVDGEIKSDNEEDEYVDSDEEK